METKTSLIDPETNEKWVARQGDATVTPEGRAWIMRTKAAYRRRTGRTLVVEIRNPVIRKG